MTERERWLYLDHEIDSTEHFPRGIPHTCPEGDCPGHIYARKLDAYETLLTAAKRVDAQCHYPDLHKALAACSEDET